MTPKERAQQVLSPWMVDGVPMEHLPHAPRIMADIAATIRAAEIEKLEWAEKVVAPLPGPEPRDFQAHRIGVEVRDHLARLIRAEIARLRAEK